MMAVAVRVDALPERHLRANVDSLGVFGRTREAVLEARPRGEIVRQRDGNPALVVDGRVLGAPPDERTRSGWLANLGDTREGIVVVFGLGVGHAARQLRERTAAKLVVYEPDPGIVRRVLSAGPCDLGGIPIVTDLRDLQALWPALAGDRDVAAMIVSPGYPSLYGAELRQVTESIRMLVADINLLENTRNSRYREWVDHIFANVPRLCEAPPFLALAGQCRGVPAFIVGAGPSLAKNVALLREASAKGIVFAVDMSGSALDRHGVEPQVLVCLEALNLSHHMKGLSFIDRVVRAFSMTSNPDGFRMQGGPLLPFFETMRAFAPLEDLVGVPGAVVGGSVSTVAFSLAEQLGCSPIVMVGQDLAYTGGRTHAEGTAFERSRVRVTEDGKRIAYDWCETSNAVREGSQLGPPQAHDVLFEVPAWGGGEAVVSSPAFNAYRLWFEVAAETLRQTRPDLALVNATEGGSHITGFEERSLGDVLASLSPRHIKASDLVARARELRPPLTQSEVNAWAARQRRLTRAAGAAARRVRIAASAAARRLDAHAPRTVGKSFDRLGRLEATLKEACQRQPLIEAWAYAELQELMHRGTARPHGADSLTEAEWGLRVEMTFAEIVQRAAEELGGAFVALSDAAPTGAATTKDEEFERKPSCP
ncbi:MAG TPA: 6-hydroxymethylpterin diphosphokinase MptE-like protein [Polyangiaceae bacterium]|nr:6-hydroxymethylpterin diphosphokinase MptE-like protein [Polyangiaceae bacterium]